MKTFFGLLIFLIIPSLLQAQAPSIQWQKCIGGTGGENANSIIQTFDGGLAFVGTTNSMDGDISGKHGGADILVVKMSITGEIKWQKCFGGDSNDMAQCIIQSPDSGFVIAGLTYSKEGDVTNNNGHEDAWIIKLDSKGNILWQRCYGGNGFDYAYTIISTSDKGYIFTGGCGSTGEGFPNHGPHDFWVVKIDSVGNLQWQKLFGGTGFGDDGLSVIQIASGGYIAVGQTDSEDGDVTRGSAHGVTWIMKLTVQGVMKWQRTFIADGASRAYSVINTSDGGYAVTGEVACSLNCGTWIDFPDVRGGPDAFVIKFDATDSVRWIHTYGGMHFDNSQSIIQTPDRGFAFAGNTNSKDGDVSGNHGGSTYEMWLVKLDSLGVMQWQKCLGGQGTDVGYSITQTSDGGYGIAGYTNSNNGDVSGNHGSDDAWIVKLSPEANSVESPKPVDENIILNPNPGNGMEKISYFLAASSSVKINLFNQLGQQLRSFSFGKEAMGSHEHEFDISELPSGVYFVRIEMEGKSVLKALELLH